MKALFIVAILFLTIGSPALDSKSCNKKIANAVYKNAKARCLKKGATKVERIVWSEKELGTTQGRKGILGGVYFLCSNQLEYLAVAEIRVSDCKVRSVSISHTSEVTNSYIESN